MNARQMGKFLRGAEKAARRETESPPVAAPKKGRAATAGEAAVIALARKAYAGRAAKSPKAVTIDGVRAMKGSPLHDELAERSAQLGRQRRKTVPWHEFNELQHRLHGAAEHQRHTLERALRAEVTVEALQQALIKATGRDYALRPLDPEIPF
jgi:hypothetical protein